jgi:glycosyltransferase involved in cell wall biosynthesis
MIEVQFPLVSVVTPSYNTVEFIEETILSVKNQTYPHIEHIIMDGGSTDGTLDIIRKYEGSYNMSWVSGHDEGQSDAVNKGWKRAEGSILGWLNSDDTYMPYAVETVVKFLKDHPDASLVYGKCNITNEHSEVTGRCQAKRFDLKGMLCRGNMVPQPATFFRREVLDTVGDLNTKFHFSMDFDLWLRIALKFKLVYIPQYLANFRRCPGTKSEDEGYKFAHDQLQILDSIFSNPQLPAWLKALEHQAYSCVQFKIGTGYHSLRQMKLARKHLLKAIKLNPKNLANPWMAGYLITSFLWGNKTETKTS